MIENPDESCPGCHGGVHAMFALMRWPWPWGMWLPKRWRYVWRCLYCGERAR